MHKYFSYGVASCIYSRIFKLVGHVKAQKRWNMYTCYFVVVFLCVCVCVCMCVYSQDSDLRPTWSLWNFPPAGVSMQFEPFPPTVRSFRRRHGDISLSFRMDARQMTFEVTLELFLVQATSVILGLLVENVVL